LDIKRNIQTWLYVDMSWLWVNCYCICRCLFDVFWNYGFERTAWEIWSFGKFKWTNISCFLNLLKLEFNEFQEDFISKLKNFRIKVVGGRWNPPILPSGYAPDLKQLLCSRTFSFNNYVTLIKFSSLNACLSALISANLLMHTLIALFWYSQNIRVGDISKKIRIKSCISVTQIFWIFLWHEVGVING